MNGIVDLGEATKYLEGLAQDMHYKQHADGLRIAIAALCNLARQDITMDDYQEGTGTTAIYPGKGTIMGLMYAALGLGESGEVQNKVKKILRDSDGIVTDEIRAKIAGELGDLLWYVGQMCSELGLSMGDVAASNLAKLADRKERGVLKGDGDAR